MNRDHKLPLIDAKENVNRARFFYFGAAVLLLILMLIGFQQFFMYGKAYPSRQIASPIRTLVILHGISMSAWVLLFLTQSILIVRGSHHLHMLLGKIGAVIAVCIFVLGMQVTVAAIKISPAESMIWSLTPKQFMAVPFFNMLIFAGFVITGILNRRRSEVHRPMMLLAMLSVYSAAISRIDAISDLYRGSLWETLLGPYFSTLLVGALFLMINWLLMRSLDRVFTIGYTLLAISNVWIIWLAKTGAWDKFAGFLLG
jgi:hypothetical protein